MQDLPIIELRIQHAVDLMNDGHIHHAINELEELCDVQAQHPNALHLLARLYFMLESHRATYSTIQSLPSVDRDIIPLYAHSSYQIGKINQAYSLAKESCKFRPKDPEIWKLRGIIEERLELRDEALRSFETAFCMNPAAHPLPVSYPIPWLQQQLTTALNATTLSIKAKDLVIRWENWPPYEHFIGHQLDVLLFVPDKPALIIFHQNLKHFAENDQEQISLIVSELQQCFLEAYE